MVCADGDIVQKFMRVEVLCKRGIMQEELNADQAFLLKVARMRMPFGKYANKLLVEIPDVYYIWFQKKGFPKGELGKLMAMMLEIQDMHIDIKINQRTIGWHGPMSRRADIFKKEYRIYHVIYSLLLGTPLTNIEQEVRVGNEIDLHKVKKIMKLIVKHCILSGKLEDSVWDSALTF